MVVFRLVGERWTYGDRVGVSIKPQESFKLRLSAFQQALDLESMAGWAIYRTEGKHPHVVRPTIPLDISSNPTREKLMLDGTILYVKEADLEKQSNDRIFYNSLLEWRKEKGITVIRKDGSDVSEFIVEMSSRLNVDASRDICEHESEKRSRLEGDEHRQFWVLTFEYREIQNLKDAEKESRESIYLEGLTILTQTFMSVILCPRLLSSESHFRRAISEEESNSHRAISSERDRSRPVPLMMSSGSGLSTDNVRELMESFRVMMEEQQRHTDAATQKMQTQFFQTIDSLAGDLKRNAVELQELRYTIQKKENIEKDSLLDLKSSQGDHYLNERSLLIKKKTQSSQEGGFPLNLFFPRNAGELEVVRKVISEQNDMLTSLITEEDHLAEQQAQAIATTEDTIVASAYSSCLNAISMERVLESLHNAQSFLAVEQEYIRQRFEHLEKEKLKLTRVREGSRKTWFLTQKGHVQCVLETATQRICGDKHTDSSLLEELLAQCIYSMRPDLWETVYHAHNYIRDLFVSYNSKNSVADELTWSLGIPAHAYRGLFWALLDAQRARASQSCLYTSDDVYPFVDIVLAAFEGREVEAMISTCAVFPENVNDCWCTVDSEEPHYYNSLLPTVSQWQKPACLSGVSL